MPDASRMGAVQPAIIPIIASLARETPGTISLAQGVVWYGPPPAALDALAALSASPDVHRYGPITGEPALIRAITDKLAADNGILVTPARAVVVTAGSNMGFLNAVLAVTRAGDDVVLVAPYYFNHHMAVGIAGCRVVEVSAEFGTEALPAAIERALTPRTRAVVTISPNNPSGAVYPEGVLRAINGLCGRVGIYHVHDEAYEYFTYEGARHYSPASDPDSEEHTISLFSLSKTYGMAGWRIGYMLVPERLVEAIEKVQDTNLICPTILSQRLARVALELGSAYCREKVRELGEVRELVLATLAQAGERCVAWPAQGAFYCLVTVDSALTSEQLAERLIRRHRVALVPGKAFGLHDQCTLRLSYGALDRSSVSEGVGRLVEGLREL